MKQVNEFLPSHDAGEPVLLPGEDPIGENDDLPPVFEAPLQVVDASLRGHVGSFFEPEETDRHHSSGISIKARMLKKQVDIIYFDLASIVETINKALYHKNWLF